MKKYIFQVLVIIFANSALCFSETFAVSMGDILPHQAQPFEENKGQYPDQVLYKMDKGSKVLYIQNDRLRWDTHNQHNKSCGHPHSCSHRELQKRHVFDMKFIQCRDMVISDNFGKSKTYYNYFRGNDPSKWVSDVHKYQEIILYEIWDGIDFRMYESENALKYDWILHPGADSRKIKIEYEGLSDLNIIDGKLAMINSIDTIWESAPIAYQMIGHEKHYITAEFQLDGNQLSFELGKYDKKHDLIIDPRLIFSSYTGSTADNWGSSATPGNNGELYGGGITFGQGYPTTVGAFQQNYDPNSPNSMDFIGDVTISKFSADGSFMEYSTYLGGSQSEFVHSLVVNQNDELVIFGSTSSRNFPTTASAYDNTYNGGQEVILNGISFNEGTDIFVSVLSPDGRNLVGSTYLGGRNNDGVNNQRTLNANYGDQFRGEVIVDDQLNIHVASSTGSSDFPTANAVFPQNNGGQEACIFSLNRTCSQLRFSTYLGGGNNDSGYSLELTRDNKLVICGGTTSENFPVTTAQNYNGGPSDGWLALMSRDGRSFERIRFIGTNSYDQAYLTKVDLEGSIYVFGQSEGDMPVSPGVFSTTGGGQFLHKFDASISNLEVSTIFGSGNRTIDISPTALMIDECGRVFISGWGGLTGGTGIDYRERGTSGLPTTSDAYRNITDDNDFYFAVFGRDFSSFIFGSFFGRFDNSGQNGGEDHVDGGTSRFSPSGIIYQAACAGCRGFNDFPTTPGAHSNINGANGTGGGCNLGVVKYDFELDSIRVNVGLRLDTFGCAPYNAEFTNDTRGADQYFWDFGDGENSNERSPNHVFEEVGSYEVRFVASTENDCIDAQEIRFTVNILEPPQENQTTIDECGPTEIVLRSSFADSVDVFSWSTGSSQPEITINESGTYTVEASESNCIYKDEFDVTIIQPNLYLRDTSFCGESIASLEIDNNAENIQWSTGDTTSGINVTEDGLYSVSFSIENCSFTDEAQINFFDNPDIQLLGDSVICGDEFITLKYIDRNNTNVIDQNWSNGMEQDSISVGDGGTYELVVTSEGNCRDTAEIEIFVLDAFPDLIDGDTLICSDSELTVDFSDIIRGSNIQWFDGSEEPIRIFDSPGSYSYTLSNICETKSGLIELSISPFNSNEVPIYIPNSFTPNGDFTNEHFGIETASEVEVLNYDLKIFDRWGNKIYHSQDVDEPWNGQFKGESLDPGIFAYIFEIGFFVCENPVNKDFEGDVNLQK